MESTTSKIVVAERGNKRADISLEDIYQALNDITEHFKNNAGPYYDEHLKENKGNKAEAVKEALDKFGASKSFIAASLERYDGGLHYLDTFVGVPIKDL